MLAVYSARTVRRPWRPSGDPHRPAPLTHRTAHGNGGGARLRALLSVANREGIATLARDLLEAGVEVFATDGTREHLAAEGVEVNSVTT